jgi:hypothetical protein
MTSDPLERAWLAGLLEGEGCFYRAKRRNGATTLGIRLQMTDRDVVERARDALGFGAVSTCRPRVRTDGAPDSKRESYAITATGAKAIEAAKELRWMLGARRSARIAELLA